jgi:hypothetical protein
VATPIISPAAGSYSNAQAVTIADTTPASTIYYTTNGAAPTTSSTKYTAAIPVTASETIKAFAVGTGLTNSAVATSVFTIGFPIQTLLATTSGDDTVTIAFSSGQEAAFALAASNGGTTTYPTVTVAPSANTLPITMLLCQVDSTTSQCLAAPAPTVTLTSFAPGANAVFSIFVTATAAIASSPSNQLSILFQDASKTTLGSASVLVVTD